MTMIVVNAQPDRAEVMTDSAAYTRFAEHVEFNALKATVLPELNAVTTTGGSYPAGVVWAKMAPRLAAVADSFDQLAAVAPPALRRVREIVEGRLGRDVDYDAYLVGYSPAARRCRAWLFSSLDDFVPADVSDELHVRPAPTGVAVTAIERRRHPETDFPPGEPAAVPADAAGWVALARQIFETRACAAPDSPIKLLVGGDITLTTITAAVVDQEVVHRFSPADLRRAVAGTMHPFAQVGKCPCGSGARFIDCHIPQWRELPCQCGQDAGKTLDDCCALTAKKVGELLAEHPELLDLGAPEPAGKVGRNAPCPCGSGAKWKKCCALVGARSSH